ncbi:hypothetical protein GCM10010376_66040 [Streptomyces violaceusniger]
MVDPAGRGREHGRHGAVGERVQRQQHQVVEDGGRDEPQRDPEPVAAQQPHPGVTGQREGAQKQHQPQRRLAVQPPRPTTAPPENPHAVPPKVNRPTHLVLCTPGAPGTITRAG